MVKNRTGIVLGAFCCAFVICLNAGCQNEKNITQYKQLTVQRKNDTLFSYYNGQVFAEQIKKFSAPIPGYFHFLVDVNPPDKSFPAGTIIGRISLYTMDLKKGKSKYETNGREYALAKKNLALQEQLFSKGTISLNQLEQSRIEMSRKSSSLAESRLEYQPIEIIAPFPGRMTNVKVHDGCEVDANQILFEWINWGSFYVSMDIPSWRLKKVFRGKAVTVMGDVFKQEIRGFVNKVEFAGRDEGNGNSFTEAKAKVEIGQTFSNMSLLAGGRVTCRVTDTVLTNAVTIPISFLRFKDRDTYVLRRGSNDDIIETPITVGVKSDSVAQAISGLESNDIIVKEISLSF